MPIKHVKERYFTVITYLWKLGNVYLNGMQINVDDLDALIAALIAASEENLENKYQALRSSSTYSSASDEQVRRCAAELLDTQVANNIKNELYTFKSVEKDPEIAKWIGYTYQEILALEASGVVIPDKVLAWAHSMQDNDVVVYEEEPSETGEEENTDTSIANLQKNAIKLGKKAKKAQDNTEYKFNQVTDLSKKAEQIKAEQESRQKDALQEISDMTSEWTELSEKIKKGEELTDKEQARYNELSSILKGEEGGVIADVRATADDLELLINSMDGLKEDIKNNDIIANNAIDAADKLSNQRMNYGNAGKVTESFGILGELTNFIVTATSKQIANDTQRKGNNLILSSGEVGSQLEMNEYASMYEFATMFNKNSDTVLENTQEAMAEVENPEGEEVSEDQAEAENQEEQPTTLDNLKTLNEEDKTLDTKVKETEEESKKLAEEAQKAVEETNEKQKEVEEKEEEIAEEQQDIQESQEEQEVSQEEIEAVDSENPEEVEQAQESQEEQETQANEAAKGEGIIAGLVQQVGSLNGEIEAANTEGMDAKGKIDEYKRVNDNYQEFNSQATDAFVKSGGVGFGAAVFGVEMAVSGAELMYTGYGLVSMLPNPFTIAMGMAMIEQGTAMLATGVAFTEQGGQLIVNSTQGAVDTETADKTLKESDELIQKSMDKIQQMDSSEEGEASGEETTDEAGEDDGLTPAQRERKEMEEQGKGIISQAVHFTGKSVEETVKTDKATIELGVKAVAAAKEAKDDERYANKIENEIENKKEERDELQKKKDEALKQSQNPSKANSGKQFSKEDDAKLEQLNNEIESTGTEGQTKLLQSLEKVEGLSEALAEIPDGSVAIDYGSVTEEVGLQVIAAFPPIHLMKILTLIGVAAVVSGAAAVVSGKITEKASEEAKETVDNSVSSISDSQGIIENATGVSVEDLNKENDEEDAEEQAKSSAGSSGGAAAGSGIDQSNAASEGDKAKSGLFNINGEVKSESKDSVKHDSEGMQTKAQIEKELKNLEKFMKQQTKKAVNINNKILKIVEEEQVLEQEALAIQADNESLAAKQSSGPAPAPMMTGNAGGTQEGGLLAPAVAAGGAQAGGTDLTGQIQENNDRLDQIGGQFSRYSKQITTYDKRLTSINGAIKTTSKRFEKLSKEKDKVVRQYERQEQIKAQKLQKRLDIINIGTIVFSIVSAIGSILLCTPAFAVGQVLVNIGIAGNVFCGVVKAAVMAASGDWKNALITLATTAVTVAASIVGAGGAAEGAIEGVKAGLQIASASASLVSSGAQMVGQVQKLEGKKADEWTQTVSQIAGAASALTSAGSGFAGDGFANANTFDKITTIARATGVAISTASEVISIVNKANGTKPGEAEKILGIIGNSINTAASLATIGSALSKKTNIEDALDNVDNDSTDSTKQTEEQSKEKQNDEPQVVAEVKKDLTESGVEVPENASPEETVKIAEEQADKAAAAVVESEQLEQNIEKQDVEELPEISAETRAKIEEANHVESSRSEDAAFEERMAQYREQAMAETRDEHPEVNVETSADEQPVVTNTEETVPTQEELEARRIENEFELPEVSAEAKAKLEEANHVESQQDADADFKAKMEEYRQKAMAEGRAKAKETLKEKKQEAEKDIEKGMSEGTGYATSAADGISSLNNKKKSSKVKKAEGRNFVAQQNHEYAEEQLKRIKRTVNRINGRNLA